MLDVFRKRFFFRPLELGSHRLERARVRGEVLEDVHRHRHVALAELGRDAPGDGFGVAQLALALRREQLLYGEGGDAQLGRVLDDVKNQVDAITNFPGEIEEPIVSRLVLRKQVIYVSLSGEVGELPLKRLAEQVRDELTGLPEVTQVELEAVRPYEISVEVSEDTLRRYGLSFDQVADAIRTSSLDLPAGAIKSDDGQTLLRIQGQAYRGREFEDVTVLTRADGSELKLGEVARVVDGFADDDLTARFDGRPAALLKVFRVGDQDAIVITDAVRRWVQDEGRAMMPDGVEITTWKDESVILKSRIELLLRNAGQGLILVFVILALFLQLRLAIWVAVGIPVAFLGAVAAMPMFDVSINMISLFAFLLVLGIVVDDAIVVGENIARHRRLGANPMLASVRGSREVRNPVFASVLTTMVAFLPMLFSVPGSDAQVWRVIPCIVLPVLALSLIESQLCLPSHLTLMGEGIEIHTPKGYIYFAMAFSFGVEMLNIRAKKRRQDHVTLRKTQLADLVAAPSDKSRRD